MILRYDLVCTNPGLVVTVGDSSQFMEAFKEAAAQAPVGYMLTSGIRQAYNTALQKLNNNKGVKVSYTYISYIYIY